MSKKLAAAMIVWATAQRHAGGASIDAQLASNSRAGRAHASTVAHTRGDWDWPQHRALCGTMIKAGDDLDVIVFRVTRAAPVNACKRCLTAIRRVNRGV